LIIGELIDIAAASFCLTMSFDESTTTKTVTLLPWDRFGNWLHCVCVVTFDLELGQAMEVT